MNSAVVTSELKLNTKQPTAGDLGSRASQADDTVGSKVQRGDSLASPPSDREVSANEVREGSVIRFGGLPSLAEQGSELCPG